jgi:hypothetical protein
MWLIVEINDKILRYQLHIKHIAIVVSPAPIDRYGYGIGVRHFFGERLSVDLESVIQSYNYGGGFLGYVANRGNKYTFRYWLIIH